MTLNKGLYEYMYNRDKLRKKAEETEENMYDESGAESFGETED